MKLAKRILTALLAFVIPVTMFSACSGKRESTPVDIENFRITAYVVADGLRDLDSFDASHFDQVTDVILFGCADFDEKGKVVLADDFETVLANLQIAMKADPNKKIYLNLLGPSAKTDESADWNEKMKDLGKRHNNAFQSGKLEDNIKKVLDKYHFDGVFFDYEFPMKSKNWRVFSDFVVSLRGKLGGDYVIGMSLASWDLKLSDEAKNAVDRIEVMSYDLWDDDGNHATYEIAKDDLEKFEKAGYDMAKLDLGVPFYARPTTEEEYWYSYKDYADSIDKNGLFNDKETGLKFSFNTYEVIEKKTKLAIDSGCGGMMVWHYACDLPKSDDRSLFNAIYNTVQEEINAKTAE